MDIRLYTACTIDSTYCMLDIDTLSAVSYMIKITQIHDKHKIIDIMLDINIIKSYILQIPQIHDRHKLIEIMLDINIIESYIIQIPQIHDGHKIIYIMLDINILSIESNII